MTVSIREYRPDDLLACRELWRALTQRHRDIYGQPKLGGDDPGIWFDSYLEDPKLAKLWVAEEDGHLRGMCGLLADDDEAELEPIVVEPDQRSQGVGAQLARQAIAEARRLGKQYVNVRPVGRNLEAIRFFHREGFTLLGRLELSIPLEGATPFGSSADTLVHGLRFEY